jgi:hypothetical protein
MSSAAIDIAIAGFLLLAVCCGCYYWRKRRQALNTATLPTYRTAARTSVVNPINVSVLA